MIPVLAGVAASTAVARFIGRFNTASSSALASTRAAISTAPVRFFYATTNVQLRHRRRRVWRWRTAVQLSAAHLCLARDVTTSVDPAGRH